MTVLCDRYGTYERFQLIVCIFVLVFWCFSKLLFLRLPDLQLFIYLVLHLNAYTFIKHSGYVGTYTIEDKNV